MRGKRGRLRSTAGLSWATPQEGRSWGTRKGHSHARRLTSEQKGSVHRCRDIVRREAGDRVALVWRGGHTPQTGALSNRIDRPLSWRPDVRAPGVTGRSLLTPLSLSLLGVGTAVHHREAGSERWAEPRPLGLESVPPAQERAQREALGAAQQEDGGPQLRFAGHVLPRDSGTTGQPRVPVLNAGGQRACRGTPGRTVASCATRDVRAA